MSLLFSSQFGFPKNAKLRFGNDYVFWMKDAKEVVPEPPSKLDTETASIVEARFKRFDGGVLHTVEVLYRLPYTDSEDLLVVFRPGSKSISAAMLMNRSDTYPMTETSRYWTPESYWWFYDGQFGRPMK